MAEARTTWALAAGRADDLLARPVGFFALITVAMLAQALLRGLLFPGTGGDDGEQIVFAQSMAWGYSPRNPPLYTWLVIGAEQILGASAMTVAAVKFALLWCLYALLYVAARHLLAEPRLAALAALAPMASYQVAWEAVEGLSHTVLVTTLYAATLLAVLRLDRNDGVSSYVVLGLALGFGVLAKYSFVLFAVSLLGAALFDPHLRHRLTHPRMMVAFAVAAFVTAPHLVWWLGAPGDVGGGAARNMVAGLIHLAKAAGGFLMPMLVLLLVLCPAAFWRLPATDSGDQPADAARLRWRRLIGRHLLLLVVLAVLAIVLTGAPKVRAHYMFALILLPLYVFQRIEAAGAREAALRSLALILVLFPAGVVVALPVKYATEAQWCARCERHLPYTEWADGLRAAGFVGGTIVADWHPYPLAGNIRVQFPNARVISTKHRSFVPPRPSEATRQCLLLWTPRPDGLGPGNVVDVANRALGADLATLPETRIVEAPLATTRSKWARLGYALLDPGPGDCR